MVKVNESQYFKALLFSRFELGKLNWLQEADCKKLNVKTNLDYCLRDALASLNC